MAVVVHGGGHLILGARLLARGNLLGSGGLLLLVLAILVILVDRSHHLFGNAVLDGLDGVFLPAKFSDALDDALGARRRLVLDALRVLDWHALFDGCVFLVVIAFDDVLLALPRVVLEAEVGAEGRERILFRLTGTKVVGSDQDGGDGEEGLFKERLYGKARKEGDG